MDLNVHTSSTAAINHAIRKAGLRDIRLQAGCGYQYFVYSANGRWDTCSEYVGYVRDHSIGTWVALARDALNEMTR